MHTHIRTHGMHTHKQTHHTHTTHTPNEFELKTSNPNFEKGRSRFVLSQLSVTQLIGNRVGPAGPGLYSEYRLMKNGHI